MHLDIPDVYYPETRRIIPEDGDESIMRNGRKRLLESQGKSESSATQFLDVLIKGHGGATDHRGHKAEKML